MKPTRKQMIATHVKGARLAKGYTQKELSDLTNISVRSIQRIENGDIVPRSYTLKTLSQFLSIPFETLQNPVEIEPPAETPDLLKTTAPKLNTTQKIILSAGVPLLIFFGCWAFIAQSPTFPETPFELLTLITTVLLVLVIFLFIVWRNK
jgi:transcriptional regulator with XRE-family HTH domain